jgi:N6-adenosine-specific RNA methylase IME4
MKYKTIVIDPPWKYKTPGQIGKTLEHRPNRDIGLSKHGAGSEARYGAMTIDELKEMPINKITEDDSHLYLWTTNKFIVEAHELAKHWGFDVKTIITWTKVRKSDGQPSMKMGYYYRGATEHCLFCVKGSLRLKGDAASTALFTHRTMHSEKPNEFYKLAEEQSYEPRLDVFARKNREGWFVFGNEVENSIDLSEYYT